MDIAEQLMHVSPALALSLVDSATPASQDENALDWALARLSVASTLADVSSSEAHTMAEDLRARIVDPVAQRLSVAASLVIEGRPASHLLREAAGIPNTSDRLFVLAQWAKVNRKRADAADVVEAGLSTAVSQTQYRPNARVFRELATPLPWIDDRPKAMALVRMFDAQSETVKRQGPPAEWVRLRLTLATTEARHDREASRDRLIDTYFAVAEMDDLSLRSECLARMLAAVDAPPLSAVASADGLSKEIEDDLQAASSELLGGTADHYYLVRPVVRALAGRRFDDAVRLAQLLNAPYRRDAATADAISAAARTADRAHDLAALVRAVDQIQGPWRRDGALLDLVRAFGRAGQVGDGAAGWGADVLAVVSRISDAYDRCKGACLGYHAVAEGQPDDATETLAALEGIVRDAWGAIDEEWRRVDAGFQVASLLAHDAPALSDDLLERTHEVRGIACLDSQAGAVTYILCVKLALRAFSGLLLSGRDTEADRHALEDLIRNVQSIGRQIDLWGELAARYHLAQRDEQCREIVRTGVRGLIEAIPDGQAQDDAVAAAAPALYFAHPTSTLARICDLPPALRDEAASRICAAIVHKQPPGEPYAAVDGVARDLSYEELSDICTVAATADRDGLICSLIEGVADELSASAAKRRLTANQREEVLRRLEDLVSEHLPRPGWIAHDGWRIAARAQVLRARDAPRSDWEPLFGAARSVPNASDRAFVLAIVAKAAWKKLPEMSELLLTEAVETVAQVPSARDRATRYVDIARLAATIRQEVARQCLRNAVSGPADPGDPVARKTLQTAVEVARTIDDSFAASLSSMADADEARESTRLTIKQRVSILRDTDELSAGITKGEIGQAPSVADLSAAAMSLLERLNAGKLPNCKFEHARQPLMLASAGAFREVYPVYAWAVENAVCRRGKAAHPDALIRGLFDSAVLAARFAKFMAVRASKAQGRPPLACHGRPGEALLVPSGAWEEADEYLRLWLEQHVRAYLKICDCYFSVEDLDILRHPAGDAAGCSVEILVGPSFMGGIPKEEDPGDYCRRRYSSRSDVPLPRVKLVVAFVGGAPRSTSPIHDRWWFADGQGLSLGTSPSGLGRRASSIAPMNEHDAAEWEAYVDRYLQTRELVHEGHRIDYRVFTF